jgi:acetyl-CoA decarbonylase/synthase complex subunit beta
MERINETQQVNDEAEIVEESNPGLELTEDDSAAPVAYLPEMSVRGTDGVRIILKNAKVYAEKVIIKKDKK